MGKHGLTITYLNNRKVYAPGDVVQGAVTLDLKKPKKVKKIKINAVGESIVKLKTPDGKQLRNNEKYFHYTLDLFTGSDKELGVAQHTFPFRFQLKRELPTSFEGKYGHVRYSIQAIVEYSGILGSRVKSLSAFTVLDNVDLNALSSSRMPQRFHCEKKATGMCFWRKGAITVDVTTEKTGYVPGEFIFVNGLIVNGRTKPIRTLKVELWQQVTFLGRLKNSSPDSEVIKHDLSTAVASWSMSSNVIDGESAENWERKKLFQIPPLIPSGLLNCNIIDVQYYLKVTIGIPGSLSSTIMDAKSNYLTIGTVPLVTISQQPGVADMSLIQTQPTIPSAPLPEVRLDPSAPPPPYDPGASAFANVPLPSYEEAVTGGAMLVGDPEEESTADVETPGTQFTPQYAFFDYSRPLTSLRTTSPSAPNAET